MNRTILVFTVIYYINHIFPGWGSVRMPEWGKAAGSCGIHTVFISTCINQMLFISQISVYLHFPNKYCAFCYCVMLTWGNIILLEWSWFCAQHRLLQAFTITQRGWADIIGYTLNISLSCYTPEILVKCHGHIISLSCDVFRRSRLWLKNSSWLPWRWLTPLTIPLMKKAQGLVVYSHSSVRLLRHSSALSIMLTCAEWQC